MVTFLYGAGAMGFAAIGLYFHRFWRRSGDPLFRLFAIAFWLFALDRVVLGVVPVATELRVYVFALRLLGFCLILYGIYDKNRVP